MEVSIDCARLRVIHQLVNDIKIKGILGMKKIFLTSLILFTSQYVYAIKEYPQDLVVFMEQREQCDHLRGEISGDSEIDQDLSLDTQLDQYCKGIDDELTQLKNKYKNDSSIMNKLNSYESNIESNANQISND